MYDDLDFSDEAFTDGEVIDLISIKAEEFNEFDLQKISMLLHRSSCSAGVATPADLRKRILECIHIHSLNRTPLTFKFLHQHFGRSASKYKVNISEVVSWLVKMGKVEIWELEGRKTLFSKPRWEEIIQLSEALGLDPIRTRAEMITENTK
jgi:hypothetical protein